MRRRPGAILPLEASILDTAVGLSRRGLEQFHGFQLAKQLRSDDTAVEEERPRRRLYSITSRDGWRWPGSSRAGRPVEPRSRVEPTMTGASRSVLAYDRELVPWLFERWAEPFVDLTAPVGSSSILDVACGTGLISKQLVGRLDAGGRIHGVDIDPEMLAYTRSTLDDPRLAWHEADVGSLPFDDDSFDVACCHQGLQFFPDPVAALIEIRRVLRPSGRLVIAVWGRFDDNPWPAALANAVRALLGDAAGDSMLAVCRLGDPDELAAILDQAGLGDAVIRQHQRIASHPNIARAIAGQLAAMPSGSAVGDLDTGQRKELADGMRKRLVDHTSPIGELSVPSTCVMASATNPSR